MKKSLDNNLKLIDKSSSKILTMLIKNVRKCYTDEANYNETGVSYEFDDLIASAVVSSKITNKLLQYSEMKIIVNNNDLFYIKNDWMRIYHYKKSNLICIRPVGVINSLKSTLRDHYEKSR